MDNWFPSESPIVTLPVGTFPLRTDDTLQCHPKITSVRSLSPVSRMFFLDVRTTPFQISAKLTVNADPLVTIAQFSLCDRCTPVNSKVLEETANGHKEGYNTMSTIKMY